MERMAEKILYLFRESWVSLVELDAFLENIEINPQFTQVVSPLEMVVIITLNTSIGETEGLINICLPCLMLEPISGKLNTKFWFKSAMHANSQDNTINLQKMLEKTRLPASAVLSKNTITVQDLLELQVGDVINMEHRQDRDIEIYLGSRLKFLGKPGLIGNKMAVQVTSMYREGSDEEDE
jgi:flagellar motor switch protein FliM